VEDLGPHGIRLGGSPRRRRGRLVEEEGHAEDRGVGIDAPVGYLSSVLRGDLHGFVTPHQLDAFPQLRQREPVGDGALRVSTSETSVSWARPRQPPSWDW